MTMHMRHLRTLLTGIERRTGRQKSLYIDILGCKIACGFRRARIKP